MITTLDSPQQLCLNNSQSERLRPDSYKSRSASSARIYRNALLWLALLPILAVTKSWAGTLPDFSGLVEEEGDAVVKISVVADTSRASDSGIPGFDPEQLPEQYRRFFEQPPQTPRPQPRQASGFGSGFIISADGYVITNAHVVNNATEITVGLHDRREFPATLVGSDTASDIALLKLDAKDLPVVTIGNSEDLRVGEWVLAIGSPFGFEHTATQGIVSALARSLPDDTYVPFIQTDVAVNPGNSGGPLFNTDGEVVGVNSQIYSRSGGYQGLSFSIPINVAVSIADQLKENGYATRGWLGVGIQNVDQALAESFGLDKPEGALVSQVTEDSPADKGGLISGDIILTFNGKAVKYSNALPPLVGSVAPGNTVSVEVLRNGRREQLDVTIEPLDEGRKLSSLSPVNPVDESRLGVEVAEVPDDIKAEFGLSAGVVVAKIAPNGAAAKAGIRQGDVIVSINREEINNVRELESLVDNAPSDTPVPVLVQRENSPVFLALTIPAGKG